MKATFLFLLLTLASCASIDDRIATASTIAAQGKLEHIDVPTGKFNIREYKRTVDNSTANIYIEGDGFAWATRTELSLNPTPKNPVALRLAAQDKSKNVIYLARPCQYVDASNCGSDYWDKKRLAPEVIGSYMQILDEYKFTKINLIGFSGGGGIAAILAAKRKDVSSLRTIAGNIDIKAFSKLHNVSEMSGSLNPSDFTAELTRIPQIHFIGGQDKIITPEIFQNYLNKVGNKCTKIETIKDASHTTGWAENWPDLLQIKPVCN